MNLETFLKILNIPLNNSIDEILDMLIIYLRKSRKDMEYYKDESIEKTLQRHEKELQDALHGAKRMAHPSGVPTGARQYTMYK